ncbi:AAA family ATPase [Macrococcoides canis]|uniref:TrlF family AAA-like ATPase n=1 Tax=Macrococcoides canis TaxID=1855823 RepID=UPI0013E91E6F|nr:AAA family ATPase [Macrococcus canis]QIH75191.1 AAA family ATPase [Macrococcus canis]
MYKGMTWFKCDLQMQTPGDFLNWDKSDRASLKRSHTEEELIKSVDMYLNKCYLEGLEIIAITDHNFIGKFYLEKLIERNGIIARKYNKEKITIFPGFEIEINEGKGVHLLCIFNPDKSLTDIDGIVSKLGLVESERIDGSSIVPINCTFEKVHSLITEQDGLIIAAHPMSDSGFLNDKFLTSHFQRKMFTNPNLLAIEIPKPINELSKGWQSLLLSDKDCDPKWKRSNKIATIMSSDCYSLDIDNKGYIGKKSTWIKLNKKNINGLRQAFHESELRISHSTDNPNNVTFPYIESIEIKNVEFLSDQIINLSPNFNCFIGGRGTGKSTLIEYIRLCINYKNTLLNENVERVKNTINDSSVLNIKIKNSNKIEEMGYDFNVEKAIISRDEVIYDEDYIFDNLGIQIFGQKEISKLSQNQENLLEIIDSNNEIITDKINEKINDVLAKITIQEQRYNRLQKLEDENNTCKQKINELTIEINKFSELSEVRNKISVARNKMSLLNNLYNETSKIEIEINQRIQQMKIEYLDEIQQNFSNDIYLILENSVNALHKNIIAAFNNNINNLHKIAEKDEIITIKNNLKTNNNQYDELVKEINLESDEINKLKVKEERLKSLEQDSLKFENEQKELSDSLYLLTNYYEELYALWHELYESRKNYLLELINNDLIPKVKDSDKPFIDFEIIEMQDEKSFQYIWDAIEVPRNTRVGRNWTEIGSIVFKYHLDNKEIFKTPWLVLHWLKYSKSNPIDDLESYYEQLKEYLIKNINLEYLLKQRISDYIDVSLLRSDGTIAGTLQNNGLSDGQKNTVILMLLLARGEKPIIIDQPEDELDSDFIYNQLVPMIRKIKLKRQIIISSHNANLPVNGDAEYIHSLVVDNGKGNIRALGGIDNEDVKKAVLDIMEGSKEAFEKRRNKYYS